MDMVINDKIRLSLFDRHILVNDYDVKEENPGEVLLSLAKLCNIKVVKGTKLAHRLMINYSSQRLGKKVPPSFYTGFPQSVLKLKPEEFLYDQLLNYFITYDLGDMSERRHSVLEEQVQRTVFNEKVEPLEFTIVDKEEAIKTACRMADDLCASTRPLNVIQFELLLNVYECFDYLPEKISSINTRVKLLIGTKNYKLAEDLKLSDVIKVVDELNYTQYSNNNIRKLNFKNQDRKFISKVIDIMFTQDTRDVMNCYEKKSIWAGLLHHIHYKPVNDEAAKFCELMRGNVNLSAYSVFEKNIASKDIVKAVDELKKSKGSGAVLRNLNYIVSRCEAEEDIRYVINNIDTKNNIILLQLYLSYKQYPVEKAARTFAFTRHNMMTTHNELPEEVEKRKSLLTRKQVDMLSGVIENNIKRNFKGKLGKVYIDPDMANYALPLQESSAQSGFGVLTKGSRIHIDDLKKVRGFTYWEQVNDIDLSVIGMDDLGNQTEFSWRTMHDLNSEAIVYSGDETSGFFGGSEFYDIDIEEFKKLYPNIRYAVFCDNVFSALTFDKCVCTAGYMLRDKEDSGEVFEPKTVKSSFIVNSPSRFCFLFALDLEKSDFVWLNCARNSGANIAGATELGFLINYINVTDILNVASFFEMMATEIVDDPNKADIVFTNKNIDVPEGIQIVREYDTERMLSLMNS